MVRNLIFGSRLVAPGAALATATFATGVTILSARGEDEAVPA